jgi:sugar phosphate isomerase/epimerase
MMNRRNFIRATTLGLAAATAGTRWPAALWANPLNKPIGIQLYTLRDQLDKDVPGTLKKVADIGYKEVEIYDLYGKTAGEFSAVLKQNGLAAPSGHYMTKHIKGDWQKHIDDAKTMGLKYMVNAILEPEERRSLDDYKRLVDLFSKAAEQTRKAGIQFCYHNHNFEFTKYGDTTAYDFLLKNLDADLVKMEMDCFWVTHAGQDPVAYFKNNPGRYPLLHIKDLKAGIPATRKLDAKMGSFAEVGRGVINWKRIFAAGPVGGVEHYYVEQDYCERLAIDSARISYEYLKNLKV